MRKRRIPALLAAVVTASGCIGTGTMRNIAPDAGVAVRYAVPAETVLAALPGALRGRGLHVSVDEPFDSLGIMVIASKAMGFFSGGALVRVLVWPVADGAQASARFVARSRSALDLSGHADRWAPRAIAALDRWLGPAALGPFPGMEVRGRNAEGGGGPVRGTVVAGPDSVLRVQPDASTGGGPVLLASLRDLAVLRGSYSHRSDGATIGSLVGILAGGIIGAAASDGTDRGGAAFVGMGFGSAAGGLAGMAIGSTIRTEVWSPAGPTR